MVIAPALLEVICCPRCQGPLKYAAKENLLLCPKCLLCFKSSTTGVNLRLDDASAIKEGGKIVPISEDSALLVPIKGPVLTHKTERKRGMLLPKGCCMVVARQMEEGTSPGADGAVAALDEYLNDSTKKILANFMVSHTKIGAKTGVRADGHGSLADDHCFGFRRLPDLVVLDPSISRVHCIFFYDDAGLGVFDLLSSNGTYINGREVESHILVEGDVVQFGHSALKVIFPK